MDNKELVSVLHSFIDGNEIGAVAYTSLYRIIDRLEAKPEYTKAMYDKGELPPVGAVVGFSEVSLAGCEKVSGEVIGIHNGEAVIFCDPYYLPISQKFLKSIQTQEDKDKCKLSSILTEMRDNGFHLDDEWSDNKNAIELLKHVDLKGVKPESAADHGVY